MRRVTSLLPLSKGLHLRPDGIGVDPVGEGLACYWKEPEDNDSSRISVIVSTFAGFNAEEEFCQLRSLPVLEGMPLIWSLDWNEARQIITRISSLAPTNTAFKVEQDLQDFSRAVVKQQWSAIQAIAERLLEKNWERKRDLKSGGVWSRQTTAKYLTGDELVPLLTFFNIPAVCRCG
jgi:hypothetical protein